MEELRALFKLKRIHLLLLLPFIVATQCENDDFNSGFETEYVIENDLDSDLILLSANDPQIAISSKAGYSLSSVLNQTTESILPSESFSFSHVKLYKKENDDFILVYNQDPIDDSLWIYSETSENKYEYRLIITEELIN